MGRFFIWALARPRSCGIERTAFILAVAWIFSATAIAGDAPAIRIAEVQRPFLVLDLTIPEAVLRARVTKSTDLVNWELTQALPTGGGEWMDRPSAGWENGIEALLREDSPDLFLRLETETNLKETAIEFVTVGDPGNPPDQDYGAGRFGDVAYTFRIGKYEVTNGQYIEFLNAVARSDPNGLYNPQMGSNIRAGIWRSGEAGSYTYSAKPNMSDKPVNHVSFWDCCRFCNWLHNGLPEGVQNASTTESGAYDLTNPLAVADNTVTRSSGARYFIPSEDEWYKAAAYQPEEEGGDVDGYWRLATGSNDSADTATTDAFGSIINDSDNIANQAGGACWGGVCGNVTTVGSGGSGSASYYGGYDMAGNVWEWNEQIFTIEIGGRGTSGGGFWTGSAGQVSGRHFSSETRETEVQGFRVAAPAP